MSNFPNLKNFENSNFSELQNNYLQNEETNNELKDNLSQMKNKQQTEDGNKESTGCSEKKEKNEPDNIKEDSGSKRDINQILEKETKRENLEQDTKLQQNFFGIDQKQLREFFIALFNIILQIIDSFSNKEENKENKMDISFDNNENNNPPNNGNSVVNNQLDENSNDDNNGDDNNNSVSIHHFNNNEENNFQNESIIEDAHTEYTQNYLEQNYNANNGSGISSYIDFINNNGGYSNNNTGVNDDMIDDDFNSEDYSSNNKSFKRKK